MAELLDHTPYVVEITHREKVLFPEDGLTKWDIVEYYRQVAPTMVPHMRGRPVTMHRFPDGLGGEGFYQKEVSDYFSDWIRRATVAKQDGEVTHVLCDNAATLVYLANQACITPHLWLSRIDRPHHPDKMIFDLDLGGDDAPAVQAAALAVRGVLSEGLGLSLLAMSTGSKGVHVVVPLDRREDFEVVRAFARDVTHVLAATHPDTLTTEQRKNKRGDRVYLDVMRNAYAMTAVAPYAIRARNGAPVAVPLHWDEVQDPSFHPRRYTVRNVLERLREIGDPWAAVRRQGVSLMPCRPRLDELLRQVGVA